MAADLGGSQISALLESVPGIVNVLRSPVADAIVNMIRAGAGVRPFSPEDAEELVQYAVRRGLIGAAEGDEVLNDIKGAKRGARSRSAKPAKRPPARKAAGKKVAKGKTSKKGAAKTARPARKSAAPAKKKAAKQAKKKPATKTKTAKKAARGGKRR